MAMRPKQRRAYRAGYHDGEKDNPSRKLNYDGEARSWYINGYAAGKRNRHQKELKDIEKAFDL